MFREGLRGLEIVGVGGPLRALSSRRLAFQEEAFARIRQSWLAPETGWPNTEGLGFRVSIPSLDHKAPSKYSISL